MVLLILEVGTAEGVGTTIAILGEPSTDTALAVRRVKSLVTFATVHTAETVLASIYHRIVEAILTALDLCPIHTLFIVVGVKYQVAIFYV